MVLHDAGNDTAARPLLAEALQLRAARLGPDHPLVGDTQRLLGEVDAALGDRARARGELQSAADLTRRGYGDAHPHARRAELSLAAFDAAAGDGAALQHLDLLARLPESDSELRKVAWLAATDAAAVRCHGPQRPQALSSLQALDQRMRAAQPEGGAIPRRLARVRAACGDA